MEMFPLFLIFYCLYRLNNPSSDSTNKPITIDAADRLTHYGALSEICEMRKILGDIENKTVYKKVELLTTKIHKRMPHYDCFYLKLYIKKLISTSTDPDNLSFENYLKAIKLADDNHKEPSMFMRFFSEPLCVGPLIISILCLVAWGTYSLAKIDIYEYTSYNSSEDIERIRAETKNIMENIKRLGDEYEADNSQQKSN